MPSYIPSNDSQFDTWLSRFMSYVGVHFAELGLTQADVTALNAPQIAWSTAHVGYQDAQVAVKAAMAQRDTTRAAMEALVRSTVARIQAYPGTTNTAREEMGITVRGATTSSVEIPYQDTPLPKIDIAERLAHNVKVFTMTQYGVKRGKPAGAIGCEVYRSIGPTPVAPEEMQLVGVMTKNSFRIPYASSDAGKMVHYRMRYINRDGTPGAWSETESATIAA